MLVVTLHILNPILASYGFVPSEHIDVFEERVIRLKIATGILSAFSLFFLIRTGIVAWKKRRNCKPKGSRSQL